MINELINTYKYRQLQKLQPKFNIFEFLEDRLTEPIWSRILGGILDSTKPHNLGSTPLRLWLEAISKDSSGQIKAFLNMLSPDHRVTVRTKNEYPLPNEGKLDIFIEILDPNNCTIGVIAVENKLDSPEGPSQIRKYQHELVKKFPYAPKMILYLSPQGGEAQTAEINSQCPCIPCSYKTIVKMCEDLKRISQPNVKILFDNLIEYVSYNIIEGDDKMTTEAKKLILKLWADSNHHQALKLISKYVPNLRELCENHLIPEILKVAKDLRIPVANDKEYPRYGPESSLYPYEIKIHCGGAIGDLTYQNEFTIIFGLFCNKNKPDIGDEFIFKLGAWCESQKAIKIARKLQWDETCRTSNKQKKKDTWEYIWIGESYRLVDLGKSDVQGLLRIWKNGVKSTYPILKKRLRKLLSSKL
jgi:hypothetical protein